MSIRRPSLKGTVQVQRIRLVYAGGEFKPEPKALESVRQGVKKDVPEVDVVFQ